MTDDFALRAEVEMLKIRIRDIEMWRLTTKHSEDIERKIEQRTSSAQLEGRFRNIETQLEKLTRRVDELARSTRKVSTDIGRLRVEPRPGHPKPAY